MANPKKESHEERFYFAGDQKIPLNEATDIQAVRLKGMPERPARVSAVIAGPLRPDGGEDIGFQGITIYRAPVITTPTGATAAPARAPKGDVETAFPVLRTEEMGVESALILTPQIIVQFRQDLSETECNRILNHYKLDVVRKDDLTKNNYLCKVRSESPDEALNTANELHLKEQVEYAQPDFVRLMPKISTPAPALVSGVGMAPALAPEKVAEAVPAPAAPDTFLANQWGLAKIKAIEAWAVTQGSSAIKVAVIDEGVDMVHEDLATNLLTGYDATDDDNNQQPNQRDGHGTSCAGIVAAIKDNSRGVAGVAPNCRVIPARIAYGTPSGGWVTSDAVIARGVRKAVDLGADVLSNSWGGESPSSAIQSAFVYARTVGRGGKGCFAPCASGNKDTASVIYPARYPQCFAVGASNEFDQRKSRTSADGENWWGSQYGPELQVVAPGVHIYTTDIMGAGGYNTSGNYIANFNGTSSATPHVAGIGALVLSIDPALTVQEVEEIIRRTCDDIAAAGRDNETGFGRVNALRAVRAASRVWHDIAVRVQFLGSGRECFMRINLRLYNSGINRVRINSVNLRSFTPDWATEIDRIEMLLNPGGIMQPFTGDDLRINNILLKANGNIRSWSYRWSLSYTYTYWRPVLPATLIEETTAERMFTRSRIDKFSDVAATETASLRFEGQGMGRSQQLLPGLGLNMSNPLTGATSLPVAFETTEAVESTLGLGGNGEFVTTVAEKGIVIEKTGDTVRIRI
ncbi:MAG: S8 family serine peptidase [Acidobacteriota bacterium]